MAEPIENENKYRNRNEKLILNEINWWSRDESKDDLEYCLETLLLFDNFHKKSELTNTINMIYDKWSSDKDIADLCLRITDKFKTNDSSESESESDDSETESEDSQCHLKECNNDTLTVSTDPSDLSDSEDSKDEFDIEEDTSDSEDDIKNKIKYM